MIICLICRVEILPPDMQQIDDPLRTRSFTIAVDI